MRLTQVEKKAKTVGITDSWKYAKKDLIKAIQRKEGNTDCFGTAKGNCSQTVCCWREDCVR